MEKYFQIQSGYMNDKAIPIIYQFETIICFSCNTVRTFFRNVITLMIISERKCYGCKKPFRKICKSFFLPFPSFSAISLINLGRLDRKTFFQCWKESNREKKWCGPKQLIVELFLLIRIWFLFKSQQMLAIG